MLHKRWLLQHDKHDFLNKLGDSSLNTMNTMQYNVIQRNNVIQCNLRISKRFNDNRSFKLRIDRCVEIEYQDGLTSIVKF